MYLLIDLAVRIVFSFFRIGSLNYAESHYRLGGWVLSIGLV